MAKLGVGLVIFLLLPAISDQQQQQNSHRCSEDKDCLTHEICDLHFCCRTCAFYNRKERLNRDPTSSFCVSGDAVIYCSACMPGCFFSFETNGNIAEECYCPNSLARLAYLNEANSMVDDTWSSSNDTATTETPNTVDSTTGYIIGGVALGLVVVLVAGFLIHTYVIKKGE